MTVNEIGLVDLLGDVWNRYTALETAFGHPDEAEDFKRSLHALQRLIMARSARRSMPEEFNSNLRMEESLGY